MEYAYFTTAVFIVSFFLYLRHGFDAVHTHNPPDTLSIIGIFYRLLGKKYVFDHHDLSPELYLARVSGKQDLLYRGLIFFERLSCRFSDAIISTNESFRAIEVARHAVRPKKIFIVRNNPLLTDCLPPERPCSEEPRTTGTKNLLFLGSINPQDGVEVMLRAVHSLAHVQGRKDIRCRIVGNGDSLESAQELSRELGVEPYVEFTGKITDRERVKEYLAEADIGVEPAPFNAVNRHSTFIKVMEYMAAAKPVVAFDLAETRFSTNGSALLAAPGDEAGFAHAIAALLDDRMLRERLGKAGRARVEQELNWEKAASNLAEAYATVLP